jgi:hypothetical protein
LGHNLNSKPIEKRTYNQFSIGNSNLDWRIEDIPNGKYKIEISVGDYRYCNSKHSIIINDNSSYSITFDITEHRIGSALPLFYQDYCATSNLPNTISYDDRIFVKNLEIIVTNNKIFLKKGLNEDNTKINYIIIELLDLDD